MIDSKEVPVKITDLKDFLDKLIDANFKATNEYFVANEKVKRSRNMKALLEWEPATDDDKETEEQEPSYFDLFADEKEYEDDYASDTGRGFIDDFTSFFK